MGCVGRRAGGGGGCFGSQPAGLVRVPAEVADEVLVGIGDVLGEFGDEVQGVEDLEVAGRAVKEVGAGGPGKASEVLLLGQVRLTASLVDSGDQLAAVAKSLPRE